MSSSINVTLSGKHAAGMVYQLRNSRQRITHQKPFRSDSRAKLLKSYADEPNQRKSSSFAPMTGGKCRRKDTRTSSVGYYQQLMSVAIKKPGTHTRPVTRAAQFRLRRRIAPSSLADNVNAAVAQRHGKSQHAFGLVRLRTSFIQNNFRRPLTKITLQPRLVKSSSSMGTSAALSSSLKTNRRPSYPELHQVLKHQ